MVLHTMSVNTLLDGGMTIQPLFGERKSICHILQVGRGAKSPLS